MQQTIFFILNLFIPVPQIIKTHRKNKNVCNVPSVMFDNLKYI